MDQDKQPTRFKHFCNVGDLTSSMAAIKAYHEATKKKVILAQQLNVPANYYPSAYHETQDKGTMVCMNLNIYEMVRPLIMAQDYIHDMEVFEGQKVDVDLDVIRQKVFVNLPHGAIQSWPMFAYPDLAYDISKPWMTVPDEPSPVYDEMKGKIIINFTERYRNANINYFFLKKYQDNMIFAGTDREYLLFTNQWRLDIPKLKVNNFLESAYALKASKFLLSNQSFLWNLSTALSTPRVLEVCQFAANCIPFVGPESYGFYHQEAVEFYVYRLA